MTYILTDSILSVSILSVETGNCSNDKYRFVIKANANVVDIGGPASVTLSSPENTSPSCIIYNVDISNGRRLATCDFDITCEITSELDNADIKVNSVSIAGKDANGTFPIAMNGKATCHTTTTNTTTITTNTDSNTFIQISGFIFLLMLTVF